jgi:hypothetical protein
MDGTKETDAGEGEVSLRKLTLALAAGTFAACASPGIPPGGPLDKTAPVLLGVVPDSSRVGIKPPAVIFHFDEVVSERPPSATSLAQLFLISPRDGATDVDWKRKDVTVRPSKGWRANTTYVVTMLPGIADLRGNVRNTGARTVFSTGPALATRSISGQIWNWLAGTPAASAYVEAIQLPDSVRYVGVADSTGSFRINYLPSGNFLVQAVVDENRNRGIDPREAWDSATVTLTDSATVGLFTIARDSIAPLVTGVSADDSVTLRISFATPLDPQSLPTPAEILVQAADSTRIGVTAVTLPLPDTAVATQRPPRQPPPVTIIVRLASPLRPGADYRVTISRVTGLSRVSATAVRTFRMPAAKPASAAPAIK